MSTMIDDKLVKKFRADCRESRLWREARAELCNMQRGVRLIRLRVQHEAVPATEAAGC